jgi:hypothetical protein
MKNNINGQLLDKTSVKFFSLKHEERDAREDSRRVYGNAESWDECLVGIYFW